MVRNSIGDIICDQLDPTLDPVYGFPFAVEVKCYKQISLYSLMTKPDVTSKPLLEQFWDQAIDQANKAQRQPILIFKEDRKPFFCGIYADLLYKIIEVMPEQTEDVLNHVIFHKDIALMQWAKFFEYFPREFVEITIKKYQLAVPNINIEQNHETLV